MWRERWCEPSKIREAAEWVGAETDISLHSTAGALWVPWTSFWQPVRYGRELACHREAHERVCALISDPRPTRSEPNIRQMEQEERLFFFNNLTSDASHHNKIKARWQVHHFDSKVNESAFLSLLEQRRETDHEAVLLITAMAATMLLQICKDQIHFWNRSYTLSLCF